MRAGPNQRGPAFAFGGAYCSPCRCPQSLCISLFGSVLLLVAAFSFTAARSIISDDVDGSAPRSVILELVSEIPQEEQQVSYFRALNGSHFQELRDSVLLLAFTDESFPFGDLHLSKSLAFLDSFDGRHPAFTRRC
jgi:hypothetical protein